MKRIIEIEESDLERIREIVERENKTVLSVTTRGTAYITIADSKPYDNSVDNRDYSHGWHDAITKALNEAYTFTTDDGTFKVVQVETLEGLGMSIPKRPKGEWIIVGRVMKNGKPLAVRCSECNKSPKYAVTSDFCPNCGAKMNSEDKSRIREESNNMSWDKTSSEQEESEQSNNRTFNGICDLNDGIADPTYINGIIDCSDLGICPWGNS